jgi:signal transduction histidine kinase/ActR/RegA family two-component response regulator
LAREQDARAAAEAAERRSLFLAELTATLASSLDYETTLATLARLVVPSLADWCSVDLQRNNGRIEQLAVARVDPGKVRWAKQLRELRPLHADDADGVAGVIRTGRPQIIPVVTDQFLADRVRDPEALRILREAGIISVMIVPLTSERRAIGAISFTTTRESGRHYDRLDLAFAEEVARRAGTAIENARLYREAQEANRLKDDFLATLSHELRTPLNAVLGWTRLLQSGRLSETSTRHALEAIGRNATAQAQLINDLLDVSRIVSGNVRLDCAAIALGPIIRDAVDAVRVAADARHVQIEVKADAHVGLVWADRDRLQQVLWNLIANAVKFTPPNGRVLVRLEGRANDIEVTITDTGVGIAPEFLPYAFDRFRQADSSSTRAHGGLGLGLAIVRHLVEMHGGTVRVESAGVGKGTTFVFALPLRATCAATLEETAGSGVRDAFASARETDLRGIRVLAVDDETDTLELVTSILRGHGATVTPVASARAALDAFRRNPPDLLLSDLGMPGEDGYWLLREIQADPRLPDVPLVALTAYARPEDRRRALAAGFRGYIAKPVEPDELVERVRAIFSPHSPGGDTVTSERRTA